MEISCLHILLRTITNVESNNPKKSEKDIKELQQALATLRKKLEEADMNSKLYEKRAQDGVNEMVPRNRMMLTELYSKIEAVSRENKSIK